MREPPSGHTARAVPQRTRLPEERHATSPSERNSGSSAWSGEFSRCSMTRKCEHSLAPDRRRSASGVSTSPRPSYWIRVFALRSPARAAYRCRFQQSDSEGVWKGPEGAAASGQSVGEAEQLDVALSDAPQTGTTDVRLARPATHLRDQLPAPGWRHRAAVDGPRPHPNHDDQRYLHLLTEDLSASHQKVSILNRLG